MKLAFWLMAAALPLAAQPKLLINAKVDTRSAAGVRRQAMSSLGQSRDPRALTFFEEVLKR